MGVVQVTWSTFYNFWGQSHLQSGRIQALKFDVLQILRSITACMRD